MKLRDDGPYEASVLVHIGALVRVEVPLPHAFVLTNERIMELAEVAVREKFENRFDVVDASPYSDARRIEDVYEVEP